eukprot:3235324-Prymnesium_polylepis.2
MHDPSRRGRRPTRSARDAAERRPHSCTSPMTIGSLRRAAQVVADHQRDDEPKIAPHARRLDGEHPYEHANGALTPRRLLRGRHVPVVAAIAEHERQTHDEKRRHGTQGD